MTISILDKIRRLEVKASPLEPGPADRKSLLENVVDYCEQFLVQLPELPAFVATKHKGIGLYDSPLSDDPAPIDNLLKLVDHNVTTPGLNPASAGHLGYIPGGGIYPAAVADYLAAVTNRYAGVFFPSPGAVRMENMLLDWMAGIVGYPKNAAGHLSSGGSIANLAGIVTARDAHRLKAKDFDRSVVYLTHQVHHSVDKALRIAGVGESVRRFVPVDRHYRMSAEALDKAIQTDKRDGLIPWLVIASAGTTDTGAVDPLPSIGDIASRDGLWFHIDGAYGAFFALCQEGRKLLPGMDRSDSIVMDPHKGLFLPYGCGAVLVKDRQKLFDAHYYDAAYMQDALKSRDELAPADLSPELSKHFRGLRVWLPLKLFGVAPFRAALEEKIWLARYFYERIQTLDGFEVGPYPDLSVVTFRYLPQQGDPNEVNQRLVEAIHKDGRVFLSSTQLEGRFIIRLAVLSFRTHLDTIDQTLEILKEKVSVVEAE
jgi:glutamate/tyrosine decarboxylase-like PLP-dependent enzyme